MVLTSTERLVDTNGVLLRVLEAGDRGAPLVVLAHGFPELAFSWRHQIPALAEAGYHVLAPDQRGYGGSSRPSAVEAYDIRALSGDLLGLLDDAGAHQAVFVGHDWGALLVWQLAVLHPQRVAGVAGLSVPPAPRPRAAPVETLRRKFGDDFYIVGFQEPGVADAAMAADVGSTMRGLFAGTGSGRHDWISETDINYYVDEFTRTRFTGGLNWYRNFDRNWETTAELAGATTSAPALFLGGDADPLLPGLRRDRARELLTGPYREVMIDGAGHWVQQETPDEVNRALLEFLGELEPWQ